jgi:hypothetical protein
MKKVLLALLVLLIPLITYAQSFVVTPEGLKDASDNQKSYIVINCDNESAENIYNKTIKYINESMKNPDNSIKSDVKNDYIRYSVFIPDFIKYSNSGAKIQIQANFDIEFRFKDGKVRYEIISLKMPAKNYKYEVSFSGNKWSGYPIFENNGKLFKEKEKAAIEVFFNTLLSDYQSYLKEGSPKDDW